MRVWLGLIFTLMVIVPVDAISADRHLSAVTTYRGLCDASAGVALSGKRFAVASDEGAALRVYEYGVETPVQTLELNKFLDLRKDDSEADIEGSAWLGDRIYWITSHGNKSDGDSDPDRQRLFATKVKTESGEVSLVKVDKPYKDLLRELKKDNDLKAFDLESASKLAPEAPGGLSIEGLAAMPNGDLLIGFRNPIIKGKALLVPLKNPHKVLEGEDAKLDKGILLDLGGRGVRSIDYWPDQQKYLIIAGPFDNQGDFAVYEWSGKSNEAPQVVTGPKFDNELHPESIFLNVGTAPLFHILSDDGDFKADPSAKRCKKLDDDEHRFRSVDLKW